MKDSRLDLPLLYKIINAIGALLVTARLPLMRLDEESVCAAAIKQTGLKDFGDPYYRQGLLKLLESAEKDANLHPIGRYMMHDLVTNYLVQRLKLMEEHKRNPEIFRRPLIPPLIITGLARSGTTFLHNMLALDPAHRAIPMWNLMRPFPEKNGNGVDLRIKEMERALRIRQPMLPSLDAIHYSRTDSAEECIVALGLTFNSLIFGTLLPVYSYGDWYLKQEDTSQKYLEYRWLLNVFQYDKPEQRLTLKAPAHTGNLVSLYQAIPNAMIIQTHRDPVTCIISVCSLTYTYHLAVSNEIDIQRMANQVLHFYEVWCRRSLTFREKNPNMIYDVFYDSLVSDPIGTVHDIYSFFDLPWTETYASKLDDFVHTNPKNKHGKHIYNASDYGLREDEISERLQFYRDKFNV